MNLHLKLDISTILPKGIDYYCTSVGAATKVYLALCLDFMFCSCFPD